MSLLWWNLPLDFAAMIETNGNSTTTFGYIEACSAFMATVDVVFFRTVFLLLVGADVETTARVSAVSLAKVALLRNRVSVNLKKKKWSARKLTYQFCSTTGLFSNITGRQATHAAVFFWTSKIICVGCDRIEQHAKKMCGDGFSSDEWTQKMVVFNRSQTNEARFLGLLFRRHFAKKIFFRWISKSLERCAMWYRNFYFASKLISFVTHIFRIPLMNDDHNSKCAQWECEYWMRSDEQLNGSLSTLSLLY